MRELSENFQFNDWVMVGDYEEMLIWRHTFLQGLRTGLSVCGQIPRAYTVPRGQHASLLSG